MLAISLPIFAIALSILPELNQELIWVIAFFVLGGIVGIIGQLYWIRVLVKEADFYAKFYEMGPEHTRKKMDKRVLVPHTKNVLPFYIFGFLMFVIIVFLINLLRLDFSYSLPFVMGALEGLPFGYWIAERHMWSSNTGMV